MITTTYTCDRCKKAVATRDDLFELKLTATGGNYSYLSGCYQPHVALQSGTHWCRACLIASGMFRWNHAEVKPPETPPTLEEMIRQIVATAIEEHSP